MLESRAIEQDHLVPDQVIDEDEANFNTADRIWLLLIVVLISALAGGTSAYLVVKLMQM